jgi:4-aminobutyrate aminotransferase/(S)-3-amino-2-methylpropionate transaminase
MPIYAKSQGGGVLIDEDGNSLIDLGSGIAVTTVGGANKKVVERITKQAEHLTHTCFMVTPYESYVKVCENLNKLTPGDFPKTSALFNSGAEAVENAIKAARVYTGRSAIAAFDYGYHGRTNLTLALTAKSAPYKGGFGPFAPDIYRFNSSHPFRDGLSGTEAAEKAIADIERQIQAQHLAAVIIEPIHGEGGFVVPGKGFLRALADWCQANGVLFIADEVQTGFARTGHWFASENEEIEPDIIITAKGIAGGMPLSGITGRKEIMEAMGPGGLGGTYGGNPLSCEAAIAVVEEIEENNYLDRAKAIGEIIRARLERIQLAHPELSDIRGRGAMIAAEFFNVEKGQPDAAITAKIASAARAQGLVLLTCGMDGNVIRFLPPLSITDELLEQAFDILEDIVDETLRTEELVASTN